MTSLTHKPPTPTTTTTTTTTSTPTKASAINVYLDKNILEVFEEKEDMFTFPLTTPKQARDFVKILDRKGCPYDVFCREVQEDADSFRDWRLGGNKPEIGKHVIDRINKPFQEAMFKVSEKDDKDQRIYTFKDFYQQFSMEEEAFAKKDVTVTANKSSNTNSAVTNKNDKKTSSTKNLPNILVNKSSAPNSPESGVDAKHSKYTSSSPSLLMSSSSATSSPSSLTTTSLSTPPSSTSSSLSVSTSQLNRINDPIKNNLNKCQSTDSISKSSVQQKTLQEDVKKSKQQQPQTTATTKAVTASQAATKSNSPAASSAAPSKTPTTPEASKQSKVSTPPTANINASSTISKTTSPTSATKSTTTTTPSTSVATSTLTTKNTTTTGSTQAKTSTTSTKTTATTTPKTTTSPTATPTTTKSTSAKTESTSNEGGEEAERPPSPITTSPHYQPFIANFTAEQLLPMINYNSDDDEVATAATKDEPGYIYLLSDIPSGNLAVSKYTKFRVRISSSKFPEKRLKQAMLFNPDVKMIGSIKVPLMKKSLNAAKEKLKSLTMRNKVDWYWGSLNAIFTAIESALEEHQ